MEERRRLKILDILDNLLSGFSDRDLPDGWEDLLEIQPEGPEKEFLLDVYDYILELHGESGVGEYAFLLAKVILTKNLTPEQIELVWEPALDILERDYFLKRSPTMQEIESILSKLLAQAGGKATR